MSVHTYGRPRSNTSSERIVRSDGNRPNIGNTPIHHRALGLYATLSIESQAMLSSHIREIGREVCEAEGLDYEEMYKSGQYNVREGHRVTVAPLTQIGTAMHASAKGSQATQPYMGGGKRANYNRLKPVVMSNLKDYNGLRGKSKIIGFDWYGKNENVLVALLDEKTDVYKKLQGAQDAVKYGLATVGIDDCDLYPPNHITVLRMGTKRNPILLSEEAKAVATDLSMAKLDRRKKHVITDGVSSIGSVAINGLTLIEADNTQEDLEPFELKTSVIFDI